MCFRFHHSPVCQLLSKLPLPRPCLSAPILTLLPIFPWPAVRHWELSVLSSSGHILNQDHISKLLLTIVWLLHLFNMFLPKLGKLCLDPIRNKSVWVTFVLCFWAIIWCEALPVKLSFCNIWMNLSSPVHLPIHQSKLNVCSSITYPFDLQSMVVAWRNKSAKIMSLYKWKAL